MYSQESETNGVIYAEEFILNSRGKVLFTCRWIPANSEAKGLIFLCHGYGVECSISMRGCGIRLAKAGYAVYGIDYEGHRKSSGLQCYIPNFDDLITDCSDHFTTISEREENKKKKRILMGESMGGAVVLLLHRKKPQYWDMAVIVAPMCKIADSLKPNPLVTYILFKVVGKLIRLIPTWKLIPSEDVIDAAFRVPQIRNESRLEEVSLPFLLMHGGEDTVTCPSVSKLLYEKASSSDKTFNLYPGFWHSLTIGELPEHIDIVFSDIVDWLDQRV